MSEARAGGGGEGARKRSGRRRASAEIYEDLRHRCRRRRKGGEEEEGRSRRCGGVGGIDGGGPAADHGCRAICDPARGTYDLLAGRGKAPVFAAPVGASAATSPSKRAVAYALDRLERVAAVGALR